MNFSDYYREYVAYKAALRQKPGYMLKSICLPFFQDRDLLTTTTEDIQAHVDQLTKKRDWSQQSRTHAVHALSGLLRWLQKRRIITSNPAALVPKLTGRKLKNERRYVISKTQLRELIAVLRQTPDVKDLVLFAAKSGLRFQNITGLSPTDLERLVSSSAEAQPAPHLAEEPLPFFVEAQLEVHFLLPPAQPEDLPSDRYLLPGGQLE